MNTKMSKEQIINILISGGLAVMGGLARFFSGRMAPDAPILSRHEFWFQLLGNCFISWFAGAMAGLLCMATGVDIMFAFGAAGVFGFMGTEGLKMLSEKYSNKL
jgi:hypothetical protein